MGPARGEGSIPVRDRGRVMTAKPEPFDLDRIARLVGTLLGLVAFFLLLRVLADVLVPFAIALLLAYVLHPAVAWFESRLRNRGLAVLLTVVGSVLILVLVVWMGARLVGAELREMGTFAEQLRDRGSDVYHRVEALVEGEGRPAWLQEGIQAVRDRLGSPEEVQSMASDALGMLAPRLFGFVGGVVGVLGGVVRFLLGLTGVLIVFLYLVFLLLDYPLVQNTWKDLLPPRYRASVVSFLDDFARVMSRYFRGQLLVAAVVGVLFAIGFQIIGLKLAIVMGLFVGLLNMIPYLQIVALVPAGLLAIVRAVETGGSIGTSLLWVGLVFAVVQAIQDAVLVPRILGKSTGLRPAVLLLGIFVWGKLLGFLGLVLAIPLTCLGVTYYTRWLQEARARTVAAGAAKTPGT